MEESKKCPVCGRVVTGHGNKKYCCEECKLKHQNKERMDRRKENIDHYNEYQLEYYHNHREQAAVRSKTRYQGKTGKIVEKEACDMCGSNENLQYHHWMYNKNVTEASISVLCKKCHEKLHVLLNQE